MVSGSSNSGVPCGHKIDFAVCLEFTKLHPTFKIFVLAVEIRTKLGGENYYPLSMLGGKKTEFKIFIDYSFPLAKVTTIMFGKQFVPIEKSWQETPHLLFYDR